MILAPASNIFVPHMLPQFARGRVSGGGVPTWYDSIDPVTTNGNEPFPGSFAKAGPIVAGQAGDVTKIRVFIAFFNLACTVKAALFDASFNLLTSGSQAFGSGSSDSWLEIPVTPYAISNGANVIAGWFESSTVSVQARQLDGQASGSGFYDFSTSYAAFPANPETDYGAVTVAFPVGIFIEP